MNWYLAAIYSKSKYHILHLVLSLSLYILQTLVVEVLAKLNFRTQIYVASYLTCFLRIWEYGISCWRLCIFVARVRTLKNSSLLVPTYHKFSNGKTVCMKLRATLLGKCQLKAINIESTQHHILLIISLKLWISILR